MKILQLVPYFLPYRGGQEKYIYNLSKYLVKMGHNVHIITSNFPKYKKIEVLDGISIQRFRCLARPFRNPITPGFLSLSKNINEYDIVHAHNEHSSAALVAAYFKKKTKVPLILTCHGQLQLGTLYADLLEKAYSKSIGRKIFDIVDAICVNSEMDKEYILSFNRQLLNKIRLVSNAVDPEFFEKLENSEVRSEIKEKIKCSSNILFYVGRLIKRKGIEWLVRAMDIIVNKNDVSDVLLVLVGDGEDKKYFRKLVTKYNLDNHILFLGEVNDGELVYLYNNSNIFVLPSLSEVCPTVVLEAMYFGLPVIATDIEGVKDHFAQVALLVPPKNENELAKAIVKLLKDRKLTKSLSEKGMELVKNKYTWDRISKEYEKIYENIIEEIGK